MEGGSETVAPLLRRHAVVLRRTLDLLAMLVQASEELYVLPHRTTETSLHIAQNGAVGSS